MTFLVIGANKKKLRNIGFPNSVQAGRGFREFRREESYLWWQFCNFIAFYNLGIGAVKILKWNDLFDEELWISGWNPIRKGKLRKSRRKELTRTEIGVVNDLKVEKLKEEKKRKLIFLSLVLKARCSCWLCWFGRPMLNGLNCGRQLKKFEEKLYRFLGKPHLHNYIHILPRKEHINPCDSCSGVCGKR